VFYKFFGHTLQAGLKLTILLSQPFQCWDYRCIHHAWLRSQFERLEVQDQAAIFSALVSTHLAVLHGKRIMAGVTWVRELTKQSRKAGVTLVVL
jgi:hypothetical protein